METKKKNTPEEKRQFIDDFLYRKIKVTLGIDYPSNWSEIIDFCYNDIIETADEDFTSEDISIAFRRFLERDIQPN